MISRVKSLDGLLILRDYKYGRISSRQSEDYRKEDKRLSVLRLLTLKKYESDEERLHAERELSEISKYVDPSALVILDGAKAASGSNKDVDDVMIAIDLVYAPRAQKRQAKEDPPKSSNKRLRLTIPSKDTSGVKKKTAFDHAAERKRTRRQIAIDRNKKTR